MNTIDQKTPHLSLPLPHPENALETDVVRLGAALNTIDSHAQQQDEQAHLLDFTLQEQVGLVQSQGQAIQAHAATIAAHHQSLATHQQVLTAHDAALTTQENTLTAQAGEIVGLTTSTNKHESDLAAQASALAAVEDGLGALAGKVSSAFLAGGIVMFSGTFGGTDGKRPIPVGATDADEGWALCDGSNGTPDLRGRFIIGAGGSYVQGATGGAASASVSGTTGETTLTVGQMPSHGSHAGSMRLSYGVSGNGYGIPMESATVGTKGGNVGDSQAHSHSMYGTVCTLPPYYALAYIMKLPTA